MTNKTAAESVSQPQETRSYGRIAIGFANDLAAQSVRPGELAELRRMDPDTASAPALWRLMAKYDLLNSPGTESKWALVAHGIALMTRTTGDDAAGRSAHDRNTPIGSALFYGDDRARASAFYSQSRLNRLLTARGPILRVLLARMFRMMRSANQRFDWYQMAGLILNDGYNEERVENVRRGIARAYYQAEQRATRSTT